MNTRLRAWTLLVELLFERRNVDLDALIGKSSRIHFWLTVISVANVNLVTAALWSALRRQNRTAEVPVDAAAYLESFFELNRERNAALRAQTLECIEALSGHGIATMPIKGAAYLLSGLYGDAASRFQGDIDLLVPAGDVGRASAVLRGLGYRHVEGFDEVDHHHLPPLFRENDPASVELHRAPVARSADAALPAADLWAGARYAALEGVSFAMPSDSDAAMLSFIHAELIDRYLSLYLVPLRVFQDVYLLHARQERCGARTDWALNRERARAIGAERRLRRFLHVLSQLSGRNCGVDERAAGVDKRASSDESAQASGRRSPADAAHYAMCRAAIAWPAATAWIRRADRLSAHRIRAKYAADGCPVAVGRGRLKELGAMMTSRLKG